MVIVADCVEPEENDCDLCEGMLWSLGKFPAVIPLLHSALLLAHLQLSV